MFKRPVAAAPTAGAVNKVRSGTATDANSPKVFRQMEPQPSSPISGAALKSADANAVIRLEAVKAVELAATISEVFDGPDKKDGRVTVNADGTRNQVLVRCSPADAATVIQLAAKSGLAHRIEMDIAPAAPAQSNPTAHRDPVTNPSTSPHAFHAIEYPLSTGITGTDAAKKVAEVAQALGIDVKTDRSKEGVIVLIVLKGTDEEVENFKRVMPGVLKKLVARTK